MPLALFFTFSPLLPVSYPAAEAQFWRRDRHAPAQEREQERGRNSAGRQRGGREAAEQPHRSFWEKLFGRRFRRRPEQQEQRRPIAPEQTAPPKPAIIAKSPTARRILVIGDFSAAALAEGLNRAYSDNPDILVRSKAENNSGLNRVEVYDWPAAVAALAAQEKPDLIIVMLGANDRQPLKITDKQGSKQLDFGSEEWLKAYTIRADNLAQALQKRGTPWLWVGLPAFKQENLNEAALSFNRLYKQATEQAGGHFVDIWEGFVDAQGAFALSGYDANGQTARLRTNDGINFTAAGRRKLAFYAEQAIELLWGSSLKPQQSPETVNPGKLTNGRVAPVNPMDIGAAARPSLAGAAPFATAPAAPAATAAGPATARPAADDSAPGRRGRADDFSLLPAAP